MTAFEQFREAWQQAYLAKLDEHVARMRWDAATIRARQREQLRALLAHAIANSPFHRARLAGIDPHTFELADLQRLPVMTKHDMMERLDDVFTDRRLTVDAVERALGATRTAPVPIDDRFIAMASGGSSGRRGVFVFDVAAAVDYVGCLSRALVARLRASGGPPPGGIPIAFVAAASAVHATGTVAPITAGGRLPFTFHAIPVTLPFAEIVQRLAAVNPPLIYGYPTMLARLADEKRAGRLAITPRMLTATSETVTPEMRAAIADGFGVPLVDAFGSTEGLTGATAPDDRVHVFNDDCCIIELVDRENLPVPDGATSDKVLITNLFNRVQPLIRYELTDRFTRQPPAPDHGFTQATVEGRSDDVLRYPHAQIHPHVLRSVLVGVSAVLDYQVRQTQCGVEIVAVTRDVVDVDALRDALVRALVTAGLTDPFVAIRLVPVLERDPRTGKIRRVMPL